MARKYLFLRGGACTPARGKLRREARAWKEVVGLLGLLLCTSLVLLDPCGIAPTVAGRFWLHDSLVSNDGSRALTWGGCQR